MQTTAPRSQPETSSPTGLHSDVLHLSSLIGKDLRAPARGRIANEFRAATADYTVTDLSSDQFLAIHRAASPYPRNDYTQHGFRSCPLDTFINFLRVEGPTLRDLYLDFKSRGHTGSYVLAEDTLRRLDRLHRGCAAKHEIAYHSYNGVVVDGRMYWLDFTIDQFIDYPGIVQRTRATTTQPPPAYYGTLVMPADMPFTSTPPLPEIFFSSEYGSY